MPRQGVAKSTLYNGPVADAALAVVRDVIAKTQDSTFTPMPLDYSRADVRGKLRPLMRQDIRRIDWSADITDEMARKIHASDGSPGALCTLAGEEVYAYDARTGDNTSHYPPGHIVARRNGAILVSTTDNKATIWIGHLRRKAGPKLPASHILAHRLPGVPDYTLAPHQPRKYHTYQEIRYEKTGPIGWLGFNFYNGAMSTSQCRRLTTAFRHAAKQNTRVIVLRGGDAAFSNGIHLGMIEGSGQPAAES